MVDNTKIMFQFINDAWKIYKHHEAENPRDWEKIVAETDEILSKYKGTPIKEFTENVMLDITEQLTKEENEEM